LTGESGRDTLCSRLQSEVRNMGNQAAHEKRTIRVFAASSFLNDLGSDIIYPIWPLFVTDVLKANMAALGFLDGLGDALVSLSQAASGYVSDRIHKRKIFIWTGYLCGALSRLGYAASRFWPHLIPFRILDRVGKIRSAPRDAMVADLSTANNRGRRFGLLRAMDNLGAVCGILLCVALIKALGYRLLFALAALPSLFGSLLIVIKIKDEKGGRGKIYKGFSLRDITPGLRLYTLLSAVFASGAFSYSFLLVYAKTLGFRITFIPLLYLLYTAVASLFSYPFGRLSDMIGRKRVLFLAYFFWAAICIGIVSSPSPIFIILAFALFGLHKAALDPVQKTLTCELAPPAFRASCLGGFQMVVGLCALPASFLAGLLWEKIGPAAPFAFSLGLTTLSSTLLLFVKER